MVSTLPFDHIFVKWIHVLRTISTVWVIQGWDQKRFFEIYKTKCHFYNTTTLLLLHTTNANSRYNNTHFLAHIYDKWMCGCILCEKGYSYSCFIIYVLATYGRNEIGPDIFKSSPPSQAISHYLSQCWPRYLSPYGVTRPQWVKIISVSGRFRWPKWRNVLD